ncbi:some similarities with Saccharomyces cerevisiae YIL131C FKH1 Forkhead family transcription factor with a minor role in the expression of G2/M phase genes [Maudiozyma barnettii]|uniref:Some similarities with Saccharomyces cerevisiae YIL131C FKH1 Forkhead family transcription factor with a minor role in the expression of G2/M phase genes n=1 Tax=Maudiozyma barnettii TaxID=61262 RepID=A0A8H2ZGF0_9SACH|nr:forkhead family transcription factor FKH1 [Kazachstania barnettii]CAB4253249.1 some similarities with Saccharomyces cerevisiae YIL131C FKH1 Forkhead family transcription factor with a minor role in the expression of G2/M phase genes [Kazachstania barnettii]CAD1780215.1 some similarities with Saccharomyces cerevisiae YIL131C FKH1 Forkhead family transcription factor with a minor role in the expression of G2/M phase genes [Kazachstania barnettii]
MASPQNKFTNGSYINDPKYTPEQFNNLASCVTSILSSVDVEIAASYQYSNGKNKSKEIKAFAKLSGNNWTYFIKTLKVSIGRNTDKLDPIEGMAAIETEPNNVTTDLNGSNIDLGPAKTVSRKHGIIEFNSETGNWDLIITGRNGAKLNYKKIKTHNLNKRISLNCGDVIDMGGIQMIFILPDTVPLINSNCLTHFIPKLVTIYGLNGNNNPLMQDLIKDSSYVKQQMKIGHLENIPVLNSILLENQRFSPIEPSEKVSEISNDYDNDLDNKADETIAIITTPTDPVVPLSPEYNHNTSEYNALKRTLPEKTGTLPKKFQISSISSNKQYGAMPTKLLESQPIDQLVPSHMHPVPKSKVTNQPDFSSQTIIPPLQPRSESLDNKKEIRKEVSPSEKDIDKSGKVANKPPLPYGTLIAQAILSTETGIISLSDIYEFLLKKYEYFRNTSADWQNSVRHTLSLNAAFQKIPKKKISSKGKGMVWCIDREYRAEFLKKWENGYASKTKKNAAVDKQLLLHMSTHKFIPEPYDNEIRSHEIEKQEMSQANGIADDVQ